MPEKTLIEQASAAAPIVAGAVIAAVLQAREPSDKSAYQKALDFGLDTVIGASSAYFLAGFALDMLNQTSPNAQMAIGFVLGATGVQLVRWFIKDGITALRTKLGV
jgi:TRAP-type mannitol/chloroaromatic compound transport system substrate-binding protein